MKTLLPVIALLMPFAAFAMDVAVQRNELREAYAGNDGARMKAAAQALLGEYSGHPTYLFYLARAEAMLGDRAAALNVLRGIVARGTDMTHNAINGTAFEEVRALPAFAELQTAAAKLHEPLGHAETFASFGPEDAMPEGVLVLGDRTFITSVKRGSILVRNGDGTTREWPIPDGWSGQGLHLAPDAKTLWVATSAMNVSANAPLEDRGHTALVAFDVTNGKVVARHVFPQDDEHVLGDFLFLDDGNLLATDSIGGGVHALDPASGTFTVRIAPGTLRSPQGLARIGQFVFIADYGNGLYRFDPASGQLFRIGDGAAAPYGIDGLYAYSDTLIAVQNGVRPQQVAQFVLNESMTAIVARHTLLANHAQFDEPTLGQVTDNEFLLVANSHWNRVDRDGRLTGEGLDPPVILSLPLPRVSPE